MEHSHPRARSLQPQSPIFFVTLILLALALLGCTVQLAPNYDAIIVDSLTSANEQTMTLFASVSSGGNPSSFSAREATYNAIIGKFDALRLQAKARPAPQPLVSKLLTNKEPNIADQLNAPTPSILAKVVTDLTRMRDQDKAGTLTADKVELYKNSYEISMDQALTYEKALQR
jgi:hypothetical protein